MASFFDEIARNRIRSAILLILFFFLFVGIIWLVLWILGGVNIFTIALAAVVVGLYAVFSYYAGSKIILKVSRAQKADPSQYHYLYDVVEGLALASQIKMPDVYIINDPNPNAFATGRNKQHASVAVTTGLLQMMDKKELQGVLAHEISHVADNDIRYMMIAVVFAGVIGLAAGVIRGLFFFGGIGGGRRNGDAIVIIALVIGLLAPLFALLLKLAISRRREYMADANGSRLIRDPHSLASALEKIRDYTKNPQAKPVAHANDMTAMLYFSNPLKTSGIVNLFSTHPPIQDRIDKLEHMY